MVEDISVQYRVVGNAIYIFSLDGIADHVDDRDFPYNEGGAGESG